MYKQTGFQIDSLSYNVEDRQRVTDRNKHG